MLLLLAFLAGLTFLSHSLSWAIPPDREGMEIYEIDDNGSSKDKDESQLQFQLEVMNKFAKPLEEALRLHSEKKFAESESTFKSVIKGLETHLGYDNVITLSAVNQFGISFTNRGENQWSPLSDYEKAVPLLERSLKGFEAHFGNDNVDVMNTVTTLSVLLQKLKRNEEAKPYLKNLLQFRQKSKGSDHAGLMVFIFCLSLEYLYLESTIFHRFSYRIYL
jgi:hypothetical protein